MSEEIVLNHGGSFQAAGRSAAALQAFVRKKELKLNEAFAHVLNDERFVSHDPDLAFLERRTCDNTWGTRTRGRILLHL